MSSRVRLEDVLEHERKKIGAVTAKNTERKALAFFLPG
jgi:hypothetical protein